MLRFRRILAIAIVIAWFLPSFAAGAVALHLALEHHGHHDGDSHRHASDEAEHDHEIAMGADHAHKLVLLKSSSFAGRSLAAPSAAPVATEPPFPHCPARETIPPASPPDPLFLAHCSLLI